MMLPNEIANNGQVLTYIESEDTWLPQDLPQTHTVTVENKGSYGIGLFYGTSSSNNSLLFRNVVASNNKIQLSNDDEHVFIDINESELNINSMQGILQISHGGTGRTSLPNKYMLIGTNNENGEMGIKKVPDDDIVGTTDLQTLSNKTFGDNISFKNNTISIAGNKFDFANVVTQNNEKLLTNKTLKANDNNIIEATHLIGDMKIGNATATNQTLIYNQVNNECNWESIDLQHVYDNNNAFIVLDDDRPLEIKDCLVIDGATKTITILGNLRVNGSNNNATTTTNVVSNKQLKNTGSGVHIYSKRHDALKTIRSKSGRVKIKNFDNDRTIDIDINESNIAINQLNGVLDVKHGGTGENFFKDDYFIQGDGYSKFKQYKKVPLGDVVGTSDEQILKNKTIVNPTINSINTSDGHMLQITANNETDTFVLASEKQTITSKTINAEDNMIYGLRHGVHVDDESHNVHGVTGYVVGTSGTQTLSNKTLVCPSFLNNGECYIDNVKTQLMYCDATPGSVLIGNGYAQPTSEKPAPQSDFVGTTDKQILHNKIIRSSDNNEITIDFESDLDEYQILPVRNGGTGSGTHPNNHILLGNGYGPIKYSKSPLPNGELIGMDDIQVLLNKTIDADNDNNTIIMDINKHMQHQDRQQVLHVVNGGTGHKNCRKGNVLIGNGYDAFDISKAAPQSDFVGTDDKQTLQNKTIDCSKNTVIFDITQNITGKLPVKQGGTGATKFNAGHVLIGNDKHPITAYKPAPTGDFVGTTDQQSLVNKRLVAPVIDTPTLSSKNIKFNGCNLTVPIPDHDTDSFVLADVSQHIRNKTIDSRHGNNHLLLDASNDMHYGTLPVARGGTGYSKIEPGAVLIGGGNGPLVISKQAPLGLFVGTTDVQQLTNKSIDITDRNLIITATNANHKKASFDCSKIRDNTIRYYTLPDRNGIVAISSNSNGTTFDTKSFTLEQGGTKRVQFSCSDFKPNTTHTINFPASNTTMVGISTNQKLYNKTLGDSNNVRLFDTNFQLQQSSSKSASFKCNERTDESHCQYTLPKNSGQLALELPIGVVLEYAGSETPDDTWLFCEGQQINRNDYPELFTVIRYTYGRSTVNVHDTEIFKLPGDTAEEGKLKKIIKAKK